MRIFLLDNYDSFTYNLADYLAVQGAEPVIMRNDEFDPAELDLNPFDGVVLSPGPSEPTASGCLMQFIAEFHASKPVLGVCLGFQALGVYFGASLKPSGFPVHGKQSRIHTEEHPMYEGIPSNHLVCRYHSLILERLPDCFQATAHTREGIVMALAHRSLPVWGVQYHPEAVLTEYGPQFIINWLNLVANARQ